MTKTTGHCVFFPKIHSPILIMRKISDIQVERRSTHYLTRTPWNCQDHKKSDKTEKLSEETKETQQLNAMWYSGWHHGRKLPTPTSRLFPPASFLLNALQTFYSSWTNLTVNSNKLELVSQIHISLENLTLNLKSHPPIVLLSILYALCITRMANTGHQDSYIHNNNIAQESQ